MKGRLQSTRWQRGHCCLSDAQGFLPSNVMGSCRKSKGMEDCLSGTSNWKSSHQPTRVLYQSTMWYPVGIASVEDQVVESSFFSPSHLCHSLSLFFFSNDIFTPLIWQESRACRQEKTWGTELTLCQELNWVDWKLCSATCWSSNREANGTDSPLFYITSSVFYTRWHGWGNLMGIKAETNGSGEILVAQEVMSVTHVPH